MSKDLSEHTTGLEDSLRPRAGAVGANEPLDRRVTRIEVRLDGIEREISMLEVRMIERFEIVDRRFTMIDERFDVMDQRMDRLDTRLDRIEDKIPSKWDIAQVVFLTVGALMAAAIFAPRLLAFVAPG